MGKIICELCGTSYSESASQCPICGCAHSNDKQYVTSDVEDTPVQSQYQHVKGGRFSKSNVKKRNKTNLSVATPSSTAKKSADSEKSNKGLVITVLVLLLAIIAVIAYIVFTIVIPIMTQGKEESLMNTETMYVSEKSETDPPSVLCAELLLEQEEMTLLVGESAQLNVEVIPADTTDLTTFAVADEVIASVDTSGVITALSPGETMVSISCGEVKTHCFISVEAIELVFDQTEVSLDQVGAEVQIYSGYLPTVDILWYSDDENIATIQDGTITAVGNGITTVYGEYGDMTASCVVWCNIEDTNTDVTVVDNGPYRLDNPYGVSDTDASISIGSSFTLYLVDKDDNRVSGATWSVAKGYSCTVEDGLITGVAAGQSTVVATYGGESYSCIVRVS